MMLNVKHAYKLKMMKISELMLQLYYPRYTRSDMLAVARKRDVMFWTQQGKQIRESERKNNSILLEIGGELLDEDCAHIIRK